MIALCPLPIHTVLTTQGDVSRVPELAVDCASMHRPDAARVIRGLHQSKWDPSAVMEPQQEGCQGQGRGNEGNLAEVLR